MKTIFPVLLALFFIGLGAGCSFAASEPLGEKVLVYYFHGNFRCATCQKLEQYSKEAIEKNFKDEMASGRLAFKAVNTDEKGNEHFVNDYKLYTKSLILSLVKDGKEIKSKNLDKIWEHVRDKRGYIDYVTGETRAFLKDAQ